MIHKGICFILSAPSGKTTLIREMLKHFPDMRHSISYTTRPRRSDVRDHKDYHFISEESFVSMIEANEFLEWAVCTWFSLTGLPDGTLQSCSMPAIMFCWI